MEQRPFAGQRGSCTKKARYMLSKICQHARKSVEICSKNGKYA